MVMEMVTATAMVETETVNIMAAITAEMVVKTAMGHIKADGVEMEVTTDHHHSVWYVTTSLKNARKQKTMIITMETHLTNHHPTNLLVSGDNHQRQLHQEHQQHQQETSPWTTSAIMQLALHSSKPTTVGSLARRIVRRRIGVIKMLLWTVSTKIVCHAKTHHQDKMEHNHKMEHNQDHHHKMEHNHQHQKMKKAMVRHQKDLKVASLVTLSDELLADQTDELQLEEHQSEKLQSKDAALLTHMLSDETRESSETPDFINKQ